MSIPLSDLAAANPDVDFSDITLLYVVMLQKWLLRAGNITDWQAGDLCGDGRLDAFDLCIMKRELLNQ